MEVPAETNLVREWLDEIEGFALRHERLLDDIEANSGAVVKWLEAACRIGIEAERIAATERAAKIAEETTRTICRDQFVVGGPRSVGMSIAAAIRS